MLQQNLSKSPLESLLGAARATQAGCTVVLGPPQPHLADILNDEGLRLDGPLGKQAPGVHAAAPKAQVCRPPLKEAHRT